MLQLRFTKFLFLAPAALLLPFAERPMLHAEKGTSVDKILASSLELEMLSGTITLRGEDREMEPGELFMLTLKAVQGVTDVYGASEQGQLQAIDRTYNGMEMTYETEDESGYMDGFDTLEGTTVRFKRGEDGWDKSYVVEEGEDSPSEDLLEGLAADMDLSVLLPPEETKEGGTWTVAEAPFRSLFFPGGMPTGEDAAGGMAKIMLDDLGVQFGDNTKDFGVDCTWVGEASDVAEIAFRFRGSATIDAGLFVVAMTSIGEVSTSGRIPEGAEAEMDLDFEGEGTLLWNTKAGHIEDFDMTQSAEASLDLSFTRQFGEESVDIDIEGEFSFDMAWKLEVAEAK